MKRARLALLCAMLCGCGGATVVLTESARAGACEVVEQRIEDGFDDGELDEDEARAQLGCARLVCDALSAAITQGYDDGD